MDRYHSAFKQQEYLKPQIISVQLGHKRWFEFDDDRVYPVSEDRIKTSAAYVLFYKRVSDV